MASGMTGADPAGQARQLLRGWLAADESAVLAGIDSLGRRAVAAAAEASARLGRSAMPARTAQRSLQTLQALADALDTPPPPRRWSLFGRGAPKIDLQAQVGRLIEELEEERDAALRSLIGIGSDLEALRETAQAVDAAVALVRACAAAVEAAARELPDRADFLRGTVAERLLARESDLLTQVAVTAQGVMSLELVQDSQKTLATTLERARDTSVAALRTAIAARAALAGSAEIAQQTEALSRTVRAAEGAPAERRDVRRVLDDAVDQARRAIDAAAGERSGPITP